MVRALALDLKGGSSRPSPCNRFVSLDKEVYHTLFLPTQVYKMSTSDILLEVTLLWTTPPPRGE